MQAYLSLVAGALLSYNVVLPSVWIGFVFSVLQPPTSDVYALARTLAMICVRHQSILVFRTCTATMSARRLVEERDI